MRRQIGLLRSLLIYYGNPLLSRRLRRLYSLFLKPGDLYFDLGAHVGNRIRAALDLHAQVVALEPNPYLHSFLDRRFGANDAVTLLQKGVGEQPGSATFYLSEGTPTVSTFSESWIARARRDPGFAAVRWDSQQQMEITTLDKLTKTFGMPRFCKIDVEGFELQVLNGLSMALPVVSFEYIPGAIDLAQSCIWRLETLSRYEYNWSVSEQHRLGSTIWMDAAEMSDYLTAVLGRGKSGDIYARRVT